MQAEASKLFEKVCTFLSTPQTHQQTEPVEVVTTHAARIFLANSAAYKIKLPVKYDYLDFSTLEKRRTVCERELEINKPYAPQIYRDVISINQSGSGELGFELPGVPVEWAIRMNRFPEANVLSRMAHRGELDLEIARELGHMIARFHLVLEAEQTKDGALRILEIVDELEREFGALADFFDRQKRLALFAELRRVFHANRQKLDARAEIGMIRRCHGDMHLRNLVMIGGKPTLFDALEFDERLATTDVLYDLAFLLMDMVREKLSYQASMTFNRYVLEAWSLVEQNGFSIMPLLLSIRAAIRSMVAAQAGLKNPEKLEQLKQESAEYFSLASEFLQSVHPVLIVVSGFSGSGKSTLAARLVPLIGGAPGAVLLRSDLERKMLLGVHEFQKVPSTHYKRENRREVYDQLIRKAETILAQGQSVVMDAVFSDQELRSSARALAKSANAKFIGLWLSAPAEVLFDRISQRSRDASDATIDVVKAQLERSEKPDFKQENHWHEIDASGTLEETLEAASKSIDAPET